MTTLRYLTEANLYQLQTRVSDVKSTPDGLFDVITEETIFYPQGGGQPADNGFIENAEGRFVVKDVRLDQTGLVHHYGLFERGSFTAGQEVELRVDSERRLQNSKLHSAGHLVDCVVSQMKLPLVPGKGYHFPGGSYVEYEGNIEVTPEFLEAFQQHIDALFKAKYCRSFLFNFSARSTRKGIACAGW